jgi:hypothetical protein
MKAARIIAIEMEVGLVVWSMFNYYQVNKIFVARSAFLSYTLVQIAIEQIRKAASIMAIEIVVGLVV